MSDHLRGNALVNDALGSALRSGGNALGTVPALLKRVLAEESWREFVTKRDEHVHHERFADFVTARPLKGLGADVDLVRRVIDHDAEALDLLDRALQKPHGGDRRSADFKINNVNLEVAETERLEEPAKPQGNARRQALRKLRKEADQGNEKAAALHAEVLADRLSAHAAMVQAGFREKTVSVPVGKPERIAKYLRKHMPREALRRLAELLTQEESDTGQPEAATDDD